MGRTPLEDGPWADSCGRSLIQGFAFLLPASSAGARSLLVPGTCDLTPRRTDASDSAAPWELSTDVAHGPFIRESQTRTFSRRPVGI